MAQYNKGPCSAHQICACSRANVPPTRQAPYILLTGSCAAQSAVEVLKLVEDALDSLYALGLPLRFEGCLGGLDVMMCGVDTAMETCVAWAVVLLGAAWWQTALSSGMDVRTS